ncbi:transcriptional family (plasmid) [Paraburkholderia caribensis MBA4]|uniref:Transcriptional family n=1 Tax=Paraburkholderia caribensis MBA4 TaxID=1323664 RepID=A0A0N7JVL7_9BURK|nr:transcriptional family [Paraburkholderia caribensis MBA4]
MKHANESRMRAQRPEHRTATREARYRNADASAKARTPNGDA